MPEPRAHRCQIRQGGRSRLVRWIGTGKWADKGVRQGGTLLLPRERWCPLAEIQGHDPDVLLSPTIAAAFDAVMARWRPRHPIALVSLCTSTRPYSLSYKWARFLELFGERADLIVHSNGGVIPLEYEDQFPYLNYNAHGEAQYDDLYVRIGTERLGRFLRAEGALEDYAILPAQEHYRQAQAEGFSQKGYRMHPEIYPALLAPVAEQIAAWFAAAPPLNTLDIIPPEEGNA